MRLVLRVLFHRVLTVRTPLGRKARPDVLVHSGPLVRVKSRDLAEVGVTRVPRVAGVRDGMPLLADGRALGVGNVVWCTGFHSGFSWIDLPVHGGVEPRHESGVVRDVPGLYFVGLEFLHALSSAMIHGVGRDAERIAGLIAARGSTPARAAAPAAVGAA
jgi:putative flavoprotein involved in K+ transport